MKQIQTWILCIFLKAISAQDGRQFPIGRRVLGRGKISHRNRQMDRLREKFSQLNTTTEFSAWNSWREQNGLLCSSDSDCNWLDDNLQCDNLTAETEARMFNTEPATGQCACESSQRWNFIKFVCEERTRGGFGHYGDYGGDYGFGGGRNRDYYGGYGSRGFGGRPWPRRILPRDRPSSRGNLTDSQDEILRTKFAEWKGVSWSYEEWDEWRRQDGLLCRTDQDCQWLDGNIECEIYDELGWNQTSDWFSGQEGTVRGDCECKYSHTYQVQEFSCQPWSSGTPEDEGKSGWQLALMITLIVIVLIICVVCTIVCGC